MENNVSHEHAPIDSYFAPIPGGEVPETFSPFAAVPCDLGGGWAVEIDGEWCPVV